MFVYSERQREIDGDRKKESERDHVENMLHETIFLPQKIAVYFI